MLGNIRAQKRGFRHKWVYWSYTMDLASLKVLHFLREHFKTNPSFLGDLCQILDFILDVFLLSEAHKGGFGQKWGYWDQFIDLTPMKVLHSYLNFS